MKIILHKPKKPKDYGAILVHGFGGEGLEPEFTEIVFKEILEKTVITD